MYEIIPNQILKCVNSLLGVSLAWRSVATRGFHKFTLEHWICIGLLTEVLTTALKLNLIRNSNFCRNSLRNSRKIFQKELLEDTQEDIQIELQEGFRRGFWSTSRRHCRRIFRTEGFPAVTQLKILEDPQKELLEVPRLPKWTTKGYTEGTLRG